MDDSRPARPLGRILLVDDDRVFGVWATRVLEARGLEIEHVLDPVTGLQRVEAEHWDLVITDVEMPRMTGLEFLERLRRLEPTLPVAVITAHPSVDRAVRAMRQPGTEFIQKPITPEDFASKITGLLAQDRPAPADAPDSVLAVGAHPGDVEIGAAGALLAHRAAGVAATILTLSPGAPDAGIGEGSEFEEAARAIGTRVGLDDLGGAPSGDRNSVVAAIEGLIERIRPTMLYTHSIHDAEPDHRSAYLAAMTAARQVSRIYCFQSPSASIDFRPAHFVGIDDHIEGKLRAVAAFASQAEVRDYLEPDQITSTATYWSRYCKAQHAEAFEVARDRAVAGVAPGGQGQAEATP
jgi:two-component system, NtrC family, response regulator HydG